MTHTQGQLKYIKNSPKNLINNGQINIEKIEEVNWGPKTNARTQSQNVKSNKSSYNNFRPTSKPVQRIPANNRNFQNNETSKSKSNDSNIKNLQTSQTITNTHRACQLVTFLT